VEKEAIYPEHIHADRDESEQQTKNHHAARSSATPLQLHDRSLNQPNPLIPPQA
jgi:hypothetical protein